MSEGFSLLLVLIVIYLYDCVICLHRQAVALVRPWREWRVRLPDSPFGSARSALLMVQPFPPLGVLHEAAPWPVSISEDGVCAFASPSFPGVDRPPQAGNTVLHRDVKEVGSRGHDVLVNGSVFATASTGALAASLAALIRSVAAAPRDTRMKLVADAIDASLDVDGAREASANLAAKTRGLRIACNALWVYLYVVCPLATALFGLSWLIIPLAVLLFMIHIPMVVWFARLHGRIHPGERETRVRQIFSMSICPPMAIRAVDCITRHQLSLYHPAAAATALCSRDDASALAGAIARDLRYPAPIPFDGDAARVESSFRAVLADRLRTAMGRHGLPLPDTPEPRRITPDSRSFCPRCLNVFTVATGTCQDCFNTKLAPMPAQPAAAKEKS